MNWSKPTYQWLFDDGKRNGRFVRELLAAIAYLENNECDLPDLSISTGLIDPVKFGI
jgi:hypothetical protein